MVLLLLYGTVCWYVCLLASFCASIRYPFLLSSLYHVLFATINASCSAIHILFRLKQFGWPAFILPVCLYEYYSQIHASTACNFIITSHKRIPNNHCCCFEFIVALPLSLSMICLRYGNFQPIENHIVWLKIRLYRVNSCVCVCVAVHRIVSCEFTP